MVTVLALGAALLYGSADFLGGSATRRAHVLSVLLVSGPAGLVVATLAAVASGGPPRAAGVAWGAFAGLAGGVGFIFFYAGLAAGPMSVVAPVSALVSTILPVTVALADGERPGVRVYLGALICVVAIVLVSTGGGQTAPEISAAARGSGTGAARRTLARRRTAIRGVGCGVVAGLAFGTFFLFIRNGGESGALWPVVAARLAGTLVFLSAAAVIRTRPLSWHGDPRLFLAALGAGVLDSSANISYVLATRAGLFGLAVVLTSLYPGITVLLARIVFGEQMHGARRAGLALAAAGILLVTV